MSNSFQSYVARLPRFEAANNDALSIFIKRKNHEDMTSVQLEDLSRHGIRIRSCDIIQPGESVDVGVLDASSKVSATVPAVVRWQTECGESEFIIGCEFIEKLSWELIGELFLTGALDASPSGS